MSGPLSGSSSTSLPGGRVGGAFMLSPSALAQDDAGIALIRTGFERGPASSGAKGQVTWRGGAGSFFFKLGRSVHDTHITRASHFLADRFKPVLAGTLAGDKCLGLLRRRPIGAPALPGAAQGREEGRALPPPSPPLLAWLFLLSPNFWRQLVVGLFAPAGKPRTRAERAERGGGGAGCGLAPLASLSSCAYYNI